MKKPLKSKYAEHIFHSDNIGNHSVLLAAL